MIVLSFSENSVYKSLLDKQITNKGIQKFTNGMNYFVCDGRDDCENEL